MPTPEERVTALERAVVALATQRTLEFVGDEPGHPFRGNQYTGGGGKDNTAATDKGGRIHKADAAARMYGEGSRQHREAIKRFGDPRAATTIDTPTNLPTGAVVETQPVTENGKLLGKTDAGHLVRLPDGTYLGQDRLGGPFVPTTVKDLASTFPTVHEATQAARDHAERAQYGPEPSTPAERQTQQEKLDAAGAEYNPTMQRYDLPNGASITRDYYPGRGERWSGYPAGRNYWTQGNEVEGAVGRFPTVDEAIKHVT